MNLDQLTAIDVHVHIHRSETVTDAARLLGLS